MMMCVCGRNGICIYKMLRLQLMRYLLLLSVKVWLLVRIYGLYLVHIVYQSMAESARTLIRDHRTDHTQVLLQL